jgi:hypothetical protein
MTEFNLADGIEIRGGGLSVKASAREIINVRIIFEK